MIINSMVESIRKTKLPVKLMWLFLFFAIAKNYQYPNGDSIVYGYYDGHAFMLNDLIYFLGVDLMFLTACVIFYIYSNTFISKVFIGLCIGKICDEFTHPFGYHEPEIILDLLAIILCVIQLTLKKSIETVTQEHR